MIARRLALLALGAAVAIVVAVIATSGDGNDYKVKLELENAAGLREGRPVRIGGAEVGKVEDLDLRREDVVVATLALDPEKAKIGSGAAAYIKPTNLLADRYVDLSPGDPRRPAASGVVIPSARVRQAVDLDQVVDVLDPDTRTRLGILINEAGLAVTGRKTDFNKFLEVLPPSLDAATALLNDLVSDNRTLGSLIDRGQRFISELTPQRKQLSRAVDAAGETMRTMSARRAQLRETIERAPGSLGTLRRFLAELRRTAEPLAPAARAITKTAPALDATLAEIEPFRQAAEPTLEEAQRVAPQLTRLASKATPVIRRSNPVLSTLTSLSDALVPTTRVLDRGGVTGETRYAPGAIDDLLNTIHSWVRSIQGRDGASHIFRGFLDFNADVIRQLVDRYAPADTSTKSRARSTEPRRAESRAQRTPDGAGAPARERPGGVLGEIDRTLRDAVDGVTGKLGVGGQQQQSEPGSGQPASQLLDFLLGS